MPVVERTGVHFPSLIWNFTWRDLQTRFRGTMLGWAWSLMLPLGMMAIYTVVFSVVIRIQPPEFGNGRSGIYVVWLLTGMVPWTFLSQSTVLGMGSLLAAGPMLRKIYFPAFIPSTSTVFSVGIQSLIELGLVVVVLAALGNVGPSILLLPLALVLACGFAVAVSYLVALGNVSFRDLSHLMPIMVQLLFFLCPVIYPLSLIPESWAGIPLRTIIALNPYATFVELFRSLLYDLNFGSPALWGAALAWTSAVGAAAWGAHRRWGRDVGEAL